MTITDITPDKINTFLDQAILARLATAAPGTLQPHVVPVWFLWDGEVVWISSFQNTRKVRELKRNARCAIVIDTEGATLGVSAVLFEGRAELLTEPRAFVQEMATRIYTRYLGADGVVAPDPQSWIHDPENLIIKLKPGKTPTW
jgi:nitroimidazol reductase NimA-like FMN-containing flavoprotein (pyridoxamine 5'-phosphate oxidase superfamily)